VLIYNLIVPFIIINILYAIEILKREDQKMKLKKKSYGGVIGFELRKYFPKICSESYLSLKRNLADNIGKKFIKKILLDESIYPSIVSIETVNKCNGQCSFCGCNRNEDKRKFKIMEDELFNKIIKDLSENKFSGVLMLVMNNEPFIDKKIMERLEYARRKVPNATMKLFTNGSIITIEQFKMLNDKKLLDELIINNYNQTMKLNSNIQKIYDEFKNKELSFKVRIDLRYQQEVLSNRANTSPNKKGEKEIKSICTLPYTDFNINPYGISTLCCCDAKEYTNFGDVNVESIKEIFNNKKYKDIREKMKNGRNGYEFCKNCDFIDTGMRNKNIKKELYKN
jgi:organic radical activating enzyme